MCLEFNTIQVESPTRAEALQNILTLNLRIIEIHGLRLKSDQDLFIDASYNIINVIILYQNTYKPLHGILLLASSLSTYFY